MRGAAALTGSADALAPAAGGAGAAAGCAGASWAGVPAVKANTAGSSCISIRKFSASAPLARVAAMGARTSLKPGTAPRVCIRAAESEVRPWMLSFSPWVCTLWR